METSSRISCRLVLAQAFVDNLAQKVAVAVEFDFVDPIQAVRRFLHELR
jgi:hypothetical protein